MTSMQRLLKSAFVVACAILLPSAAYAQASIAGVARDASGAVLPGVTVEAASPALIEKVRSVVSDGSGQYRIVDLRPGTYSVTFTLPGFATVKRDGIELAGAVTATVNAEMRVGGVEETITVTGATPVVDVQGVQQQRVMGKDVIDALPTGRTTTNMAVLIPGMVLSTTFSGESQDVGGNTGDVMQALSIHGGRGGDLRRMVDGLSMQSFGSNSSAFAPNSGMIQEVAVDVAAGSAEQSTGGVRINIVPREGGNNFSGSFFATGTSDALQSDNIDQELRDRGLISASKVKSNWEVNPAFGGPLVRDRLWFFASGRVQQVNNYIGGALRNANAGDPNSFLYAPDPTFQGSRDSEWKSVNGRLTWQVNPEEQTQLLHGRAGTLQLHRHAGADVARVVGELRVPVEAAGHADLLRAGLQPHPGRRRLRPQARGLGLLRADGRQRRRGPDRRQRPGERGLLSRPARLLRHLDALPLRADGQLVARGGVLHHRRPRLEGRLPGPRRAHAQLLQRAGGGRPVLHVQRRQPGADHAAFALRGADERARRRHLRSRIAGRWDGSRRTSGLRYDFYRTSYPTQTLGPNVYTPNRNVTFQAGDVASFNDLTPKLGVAYDLFGTGRTALKASYSKYVEQMSYGGHVRRDGDAAAAHGAERDARRGRTATATSRPTATC